MIVFKILGIGALALVLAACGALQGPSRRAAKPREHPSSPMEMRAPGTVYHIDEAQSELRILVYRAGPLARSRAQPRASSTASFAARSISRPPRAHRRFR